jgi:uncharacterized protein (TIGR03435 family)
MGMRRILAFATLFCFVVFGFAFAKDEFEVASVKPDHSENGVSGGCHGTDSKPSPAERAPIPLGRCIITSAALRHLIAIAYGIRLDNMQGGADFIWGNDRFDVEGIAENPSTATEEQLSTMLQNLLADRFKLKVHRETKSLSGYALMIAKNGLKIKESSGDGQRSLRVRGAAIFKPDALEQKNLNQNTIIAERVPLSQLASTLSQLANIGPVIDKTELTGAYDFTLAWEPGESLNSVLQEQLGLRLESQKVTVELLVVDSAEKPTAN